MDSIGQRLKAAREKKRVSLSQAALKTHIKIQHLEGMERGDFSKIPAPIYVRGFLRTYAGFLGIDPAPLVKEYEENGGATRPPAPPISSKIIKTAPGEQPLPTATVDDLAAAGIVPEENPASPSTSDRSMPALNTQAMVTAGLVIAAILLIVGIIKYWPASNGEESAKRQTVVEIQRPVERSAHSITREPPAPFVDIGTAGGRAP